jgi:hypothetical protein
MSYILARLMEASTWRGILFLLTALGVQISPEQTNSIITAAAAVIGAISVFLPDSFKPKAPVHQAETKDAPFAG